jgi:hypothetical protein
MNLPEDIRLIALITGPLLSIIGGGWTLMALGSFWSVAHMWPVLLVSVPVLLVGIKLFRFGLGPTSSRR